MSTEAMKLALEAAYLAGWNASGEGYNAEYPFGDHARNPEEDAAWIKNRDNALREALAQQPAQQEPVAWANPNDLQNFDMKVRTNAGPLHTVPLYTSPPAQEFVCSTGLCHYRKPLTDEEIVQGNKESWVTELALQSAVWWAEAKLKEKNHD